MSNTVTRKTTLTNGPVLRKAVEALGGDSLGIAKHTFYDGGAFGHRIRIPRFGGTIVVDTEGTMHFDNDYLCHGQKALDGLVQQYAVSAAEEVFVPQRYAVEKETLENGSIKMTITLGRGYGTGAEGDDTQGGYNLG